MKKNTPIQNKSLVTLIFLLYTVFCVSQTTQTFNTSGNFSITIPAGVTQITIDAYGGGGGGGSSNNTSSNGGSGGGSGAYAKGIHTVTPGSTYWYTVGAGGSGGPANSTTAPTAGTSSWFNATPSTNSAPSTSALGTLAVFGGAGANNSTTTPSNRGNASSSLGNNATNNGNNGVAGANNGGGNGGACAPPNSSAGGAGSTTTNGTNGSIAGAGGGGGDDTAATKGGNGASGQVAMTWTCPTYALTSAATATGPLCGISTSVVTLRSTSLTSGTYTVTYNLTGATTATGATATMTFTAGSPGTGTFTTPSLNIGTTGITVTNLSSFSACSTTISSNNTASVTVNPNLPASVSISTSTTTICTGTNVTFTATPTNGGTTPSYQWKVNGVNVATGTTYSSTTLANNDAVTCVMTSNATPCLTGSPATSNTVTMTVNPNVTASVSISASASSICAGTNVTFTATPTNGGTTPSYQWKVNGVNVATGTTYSSTTLANGDAVTCVMTSNAPCVSASPATSNTVTMTVIANTPASVSISASTMTICSGTNVTFTATPTNGGTTPSYQWKVNGVNVATGTTYSSTTLANNDAVTCVMTSNATPCLTGSPATSNTITMTVNPNLTPSVIISTSSTSVCVGANVTFTATPTNGGTSPSYQWKVNGTNVGTNSATYNTTTLVNSNVVTCVMTSNATPCLVTATATSNLLTMTVNSYVVPSVSISTTTTTICSGTNVTFTAIPTNGGTTPSYQWTLNGTNVGTNSTTYSSTTLTSGDQIVCIMTSNAPCVSVSSVTSNTVTMTVNTTPSVTSTTPGSRTGVGTVVLGATNPTGSTIYWYTTLSGGTSIASGTSFTTPSLSATTTYYIEATTPSGCTSSPRIAVVATIYTPEIDIQGNLVSITDEDTTPAVADWTDFNGASSRTFTIYNTGTGILNVGAITFSGTNASEFTITVAPSASVASGDNTSFTVQFTPTATGTRTATISIVNDDSNENPYNFDLKGTGTAQEINIQGNSVNIVDGATSPNTGDWTDFSNVTTTRTFTIQNTGSITLTVGAITFTGTNPGDFSVLTSPSATVAGRSQTTFTIKFTAGATGSRSAIINIVNNDATENPYNFTIQGNTTSINMNVKASTVLISDGKTATSTTDWTDFGSTNVSAPITRTFTIENTGTAALNLTGTPKVVLSGSTDFSVTTQPSSPITASNTTTFVITFNPTSTGAKNATVSIANNDVGTGKNPYTYNITGTGIQAFIDSDGDSIYNNLDADDDNDGIPDNIEQSYASGSVLGTQVQITLLNETFGTGTTRGRIYDNVSSASTTYCWEDGTTARAADECDTSSDLNDGEYTVSNSAQIASWASSYWYTGVDHTPSDTNGKMGLFNATNDITEEFYRTTIQGVITNTPVTYSFWVLNLDRSDAPSIDSRNRPNITVEFRDLSNTLISSINTGDIAPTTAGNTAGNWFQFSATFNPTTTGFTVVFRNNQLGGTGNDLALDDILIKQKLTDSDQDGIADAYDLDSDNDGIGDIIEDGWTTQANGKDTMDLTATTWIDTNSNGQLDASETAYAGVGYPKNSDSDLVPNYIDLDSDNDSIFDVDEMGLLNGDGDVNGDGEGEGTDVDGDGILSSFDTVSGFANSGKALPNNTLGSGNYDYMKVISKTAGVYDISTTLYSSLDANSDGKIDGSTDVDRDGILDAFDTNTAFYGSPRDLDRKLLLDFDGRNDYGQGTSILGGLSNASLMAWIDLNSAFSTTGTIVGQDKFQLRITSTRNIEAVVNSTTLTFSTTTLNTSQWYHVGAVYDGSTLKLYLNGVMVASTSVSGNIAADTSLLTLGKSPSSSTNYFKGKIDEVRIFNVALTDSQFQRMVYQEIQNSSSQVRGLTVPRDVGSLPFTNVLRYYRMDAYKNDIIDDLTTSGIDTGTGMKIYNHKNIYVQQAPMPFITERTGSFATAVNSPTKDIRGLDVMDQDWSIVQVSHNITETSNNTDLAIFIDSGVTVNMTNDTKIQNDWYLKLDGKIDLVGKSQLVQTTSSNLDPSSIGSIERDQQGQSNLYNYNYWCSPTSPINSVSNNNDYTIDDVLRDGTNPENPVKINWITSYNGSPTSPISISTRWLYKFDDYSNDYANWYKITETTPLRVGQGYTMKGSGSASSTQNLTFVGKPNNGTITTNTVSSDQLLLTGNPYPSALDASQFINDNSSSIDGTLYFWEHYSSNDTHILRDYQGGYATRNLTGGIMATSSDVDYISKLGTPSKGIPNQYIPVGQGFFVNGKIGGGGIVSFNNGQRKFEKEDTAGVSNPLYKTTSTTKKTSSNNLNNNANDPIETDNFKKIRLGFNSSNMYHKQVLLGFMNEKATSDMDYGYDGLNLDDIPNDVYFLNGENQLVIQGEGFFDCNASYPIGIKIDEEGEISFVIDELENFDNEQSIFIYDKLTDTYHNIRNEKFEVTVPSGIDNTRFSLQFRDKTLKINNNTINNIQVKHIQNNNMIIINNLLDVTVEKVTLFDILGQSIANWKVENQDQQNIQIPIKGINSGVYIAKIETSNGSVNKKIIIK